MKILRILAVGFVLGSIVNLSVAFAAILQVDGADQLTGATNVLVGTDTFSVSFVDGSCTTIFIECGGSIASFAFFDQASATAAGEALLDQVFIDVPQGLFDTDPELTFGCTDTQTCQVFTPYSVVLPDVEVLRTLNHRPPFIDNAFQTALIQGASSTVNVSKNVYAVWTLTPVPTPSAFLLMGTGLAAFVSFRRWQNRVCRQ